MSPLGTKLPIYAGSDPAFGEPSLIATERTATAYQVLDLNSFRLGVVFVFRIARSLDFERRDLFAFFIGILVSSLMNYLNRPAKFGSYNYLIEAELFGSLKCCHDLTARGCNRIAVL